MQKSENAMSMLFDWVHKNGGQLFCEVREDELTKVRGLYAIAALTEPDTPILAIPDNLVISPSRIEKVPFSSENDKITYADVFALQPSLFDQDFPYEPNREIPNRLHNPLASDFQLTFFLIAERLKGNQSFW